MAWIIRDVPSYWPWNARGTVVNPCTNEPKIFRSLAAAQSYAKLSLFKGAKIEERK